MKLSYTAVVVAISGIAALIGCTAAPAPASSSDDALSKGNDDTNSQTPAASASAAPSATPSTPASSADGGTDACQAAFNSCIASNPAAVADMKCVAACQCDANSETCACADACDQQCDSTCQQVLDGCDTTASKDAACAAQSAQCDAQFAQCAASNPTAAATLKCENACQCDDSSSSCPCIDQCDQACDTACQQLLDTCSGQLGAQCQGG